MKKERREAIRYLERYVLWEMQVKLIDEQMFENERLLHSIRDLAREEDGAGYLTLLASGLKKQKELSLKRMALNAQRNLIRETVNLLPPPERRVIERCFLDGDCRRASEDLMEELEFEKSHIYRLRERGLDRIAALIGGGDTVFCLPSAEESDQDAG